MKKKNNGIVALKSRYGWICVSPWIVGLVLFFALPIVQSIWYSFSEVKLLVGGVSTDFIGAKNFKYIFAEDPDYVDNLMSAVLEFLYSFPVILIISIILGLLLNQKFKGRIFFRGLYFIPVIIASGAVLKTILTAQETGISNIEQDQSVAMAMFDVKEIIGAFGLPEKVSDYFTVIINGITSLIWNSGIQTVLIIAGLQGIPSTLYEVSKVEGASRWEEFWFITLPMLSRVIVLVSVFTMVEQMTSQSNPIMSQAYRFMDSQFYGESSAMLWSYFAIIGIVMAVLLLLFNHFCLKKWE